MPAVSMAFPILPGKLAEWRQMCQEMQGPRAEEYRASRRRLGMTKEMAFHQPTPQGDLAIVYSEMEDVDRAMQQLGTSDEPFDRWFRERVKEIHGFDFAQPPPGPLPELAFEGPLG